MTEYSEDQYRQNANNLDSFATNNYWNDPQGSQAAEFEASENRRKADQIAVEKSWAQTTSEPSGSSAPAYIAAASISKPANTSSGSTSGSSSSNDGCFVTTAAYGDSEHPMVQEFRTFRDGILSKTTPGRKFISWYYKEGPILAGMIEGKKIRQLAARTILTPLATTLKIARKALHKPIQ